MVLEKRYDYFRFLEEAVGKSDFYKRQKYTEKMQVLAHVIQGDVIS